MKIGELRQCIEKFIFYDENNRASVMRTGDLFVILASESAYGCAVRCTFITLEDGIVGYTIIDNDIGVSCEGE